LLVDTGADVTLLPLAAIEQLGVPLVADVKYELAAFDGTKSLVSVAVIDMIFLNRVYRGRYLLVDATEGVLGRDVLNHLRLLFDGPGQQWSEPNG
jgi:predicted aspartyl protease